MKKIFCLIFLLLIVVSTDAPAQQSKIHSLGAGELEIVKNFGVNVDVEELGVNEKNIIREILRTNVFSKNTTAPPAASEYYTLTPDVNKIAHITEPGTYYIDSKMYKNVQISVEADDVVLLGYRASFQNQEHKAVIMAENVKNLIVEGFTIITDHEGIHINDCSGTIEVKNNWVVVEGEYSVLKLGLAKKGFNEATGDFQKRYEIFKKYFPIPTHSYGNAEPGIWVVNHTTAIGIATVENNYSMYGGPAIYVAGMQNAIVKSNCSWNTACKGIIIEENEFVEVSGNLIKHPPSNGLDGGGSRRDKYADIHHNFFITDEPYQYTENMGEIWSIDSEDVSNQQRFYRNLCLNISDFLSAGILLGRGSIEISENVIFGNYAGAFSLAWDHQSGVNPYIRDNFVFCKPFQENWNDKKTMGAIFRNDTGGTLENNVIIADYGIYMADTRGSKIGNNLVSGSSICGLCLEDSNSGGIKDVVFEANVVEYNSIGLLVSDDCNIVKNVTIRGGSISNNKKAIQGDTTGITFEEVVMTGNSQ